MLRLLAGGQSNAEVARTLMIAVTTMEIHSKSMFGKLRVPAAPRR
jgi:ATP/maltotriose-dependent transcriptional regulator MalT